MTNKSQTELNNEMRKVYQKASEKLDEIDLSLSEMENLVELQRTDWNSRGGPDKNPKEVHNTYLDKNDIFCPFGLCGGSRGVKIGPKSSMQCPCVKPHQLREYRNRQPQEVYSGN